MCQRPPGPSASFLGPLERLPPFRFLWPAYALLCVAYGTACVVLLLTRRCLELARGASAGQERTPPPAGDAERKDDEPQRRPSLPMGLMHEESVYALTPDGQWLRPTWTCALLCGVLLATFLLCFLPSSRYEVARPVYSAFAAGLLLKRVHYYTRKGWNMYFIDLCFVSSILMVWSMWYCTGGRCSSEWWWAVFVNAQGPVAGATFVLQTPLTLHHPEGFESFFLHVSPMWILYSMRYRWLGQEAVPEVGAVPEFGTLIWAGFVKLYLPWLSVYVSILLLQPFASDRIAGYETLMDLILFPARDREERLAGKRQYKTFTRRVLAVVAGHCVMSVSGMAAAALAYRCEAVQIVWIICVLLGTIYVGMQFYYRCANPEGLQDAHITDGLGRMSLAWVAVLLTLYFAC